MSDILKKTREICQLLEIKPSRSKGQNFLINEKIYNDIIAAAEIKKEDVVLEVGPGLGFLTAKLADEAKQVIAVELDDNLANYLTMAVSSQDVENVDIINQDVLKFNLHQYFIDNKLDINRAYKIVANLPYNISSIFLRTFLSSGFKPKSVTLMLQKEVAERIIATSPDNNLLALSVAFYGEAKIIREVKAGNFWPEPKVDSAVIHIETNDAKSDLLKFLTEKGIKVAKEKNNHDLEKEFFRLLKVSFSAKRKMIKNNIVAGFKISASEAEKAINLASLKPKSRAEDLGLEDFKNLFAALY